jgi:hypothetical protein
MSLERVSSSGSFDNAETPPREAAPKPAPARPPISCGLYASQNFDKVALEGIDGIAGIEGKVINYGW